jgi:hypothetical protein
MTLAYRQQALDGLLAEFRPLWSAQPFREPRPDWCRQWPALEAELLALDDSEQARPADDGEAALAFVARHVAGLAALNELARVADCSRSSSPDCGPFWAYGIPGRKRAQIEAFAASAVRSGQPLIDWCGGKGHLGRLLALHWKISVTTLEINRSLCAEGEKLAGRARAAQDFVAGDVTRLPVTNLPNGGHAAALHACGHLHRALVGRVAASGLVALDVAPCCYHLGVAGDYVPMSGPLLTRVTGDDARLAVTESVTSAPRQRLQRDREMAWKLAFDAWRRLEGDGQYVNFRPVPAAWMRASFAEFMVLMTRREQLPEPGAHRLADLEQRGWERQREVMRLSIVRHAFRRPLEIWLALDLAVRLENDGYSVSLGRFCERRLTPRNLLISARLR